MELLLVVVVQVVMQSIVGVNKVLRHIILFLLFFPHILFSISSSGGVYTQNIKSDSFADNSTTAEGTADSVYSQRISGTINVVGISDVNKTRFGVLDFVNHPPNVTTLTLPTDASTSTSRSVTFQFNVTDDFALSNCSLWTDETGTFAQTKVNDSGITNNVANQINYTFSADGTYKLNIQCTDTRLDVQPVYSRFYSSNYTITISTPRSSSSSSPNRQLSLNSDFSTICAPGQLKIKTTDSNGAVSDVRVILLYYNRLGIPNIVGDVLTDNLGFSSFNLSREGSYSISTTRSGYQPIDISLNIQACKSETNKTLIAQINKTKVEKEEKKPVLFNIEKPNYVINATVIQNLTIIRLTYTAPEAGRFDFFLRLPIAYDYYINNLVSIVSNKGPPTTIEQGSIVANWKNFGIEREEQFTIDIKILRNLSRAEISEIGFEPVKVNIQVKDENKSSSTTKKYSEDKNTTKEDKSSTEKDNNSSVYLLIGVFVLVVFALLFLFKKFGQNKVKK